MNTNIHTTDGLSDAVRRRVHAFFKAAGPNTAAFKALFDDAPELCFYMKDTAGRIMAINRRNCNVCNIRSEADALGKRSSDLFPPLLAKDYMALDHEVLRTGKPVLNRITAYPADNSGRFMLSDVYPLRDARGKLIGTARAYRFITDAPNGTHRYGSLRNIADYIAEHYAEEISLVSLAQKADMGLSVFKRTFREVFGMPPGKYVLNTRLNAARHLLETTEKLVTDIAHECGFYDQSHFTRLFRQVRGITPGAYRAKAANRAQ